MLFSSSPASTSRATSRSLSRNVFGPLEFEIAALSNVKADGTLRLEQDNDDMMKVLKGNMGWHADSTYMPVQAKGAVFSAEVVPASGGRTGWADMRAAYDALDEDLKAKIETLSAYHSLHYSQAKLGHNPRKADGQYSGYGFHDGPVPLRPLVKTHPETGRKSLLIGRHAHNIPGMDKDASERLLQELVDFACRPPRTYHQAWEPGDRQSLLAASGDAVGHDPAARDVAQPHRRRCGERGA